MMAKAFQRCLLAVLFLAGSRVLSTEEKGSQETAQYTTDVTTSGLGSQETAQCTTDIATSGPADEGTSTRHYNQSNTCPNKYPRDCFEVFERCPSATNGVHIIQPDGYPYPFQAFCENGWTVIQRRGDGSTRFDRLWEDYKVGFGTPSNDHWIGNEKISALTNQSSYEVQINLVLTDGSTITLSYEGFRISGEAGNYALTELGQFSSGGNGTITQFYPCDRSSQKYCPRGFLLEFGECIPVRFCGCFWVDMELLIPYGQSFLNNDCTVRMSCINNRLIRQEYGCSPNARCMRIEGAWQCSCHYGYGGDGVNCAPWRDCADVYRSGYKLTGQYPIHPTTWPGAAFNVSCNMSDGGGWTVFQRRIDGDVDFYRSWNDYRNGFGDVNDEHWLGNEQLYHISNQGYYELRVDVVDRDGAPWYAKYTTFRIEGEGDNYRLSLVRGGRGNFVGYDILSWLEGRSFSTFDRDNDGWSRFHCAEQHRGGWWFQEGWQCSRDYYSPSDCPAYCSSADYLCALFPVGEADCALCAWVHLNGDYNSSTRGTNIFWIGIHSSDYGRSCGLQFSEMKIRPV